LSSLNKKTKIICKISRSHGGEYEDDTTFWDIAQCHLVQADRRFRGAMNRRDDGGSTHP
jgi:hypothetical protein